MWTPPPTARASYIAASACLRSVSGVSASSGKMLMPTLASSRSSAAAERERRVHGVGDPVADRLGVVARVDRQVAHQHEEPFAALARDEVAGPHRGAQPRGHLGEQLLAELGAKRIVHAPEVVDVRERESDRRAGGTGVRDGVGQRVFERDRVVSSAEVRGTDIP